MCCNTAESTVIQTLGTDWQCLAQFTAWHRQPGRTTIYPNSYTTLLYATNHDAWFSRAGCRNRGNVGVRVFALVGSPGISGVRDGIRESVTSDGVHATTSTRHDHQGRVSLAIWMAGVAREINLLAQASQWRRAFPWMVHISEQLKGS